MAKKVNATQVLVDLGPSSGTLNQIFVMSCDYILPPAFADYFSFQSFKHLVNSVLVGWFKWHDKILSAQNEKKKLFADVLFKANKPRILPVVVTNYSVREFVNQAPSSWIQAMRNVAKMVPDEIDSVFESIDGYRVLALVKSIGSLQQTSHTKHVAWVELKGADESTKSRYKALIQALSKIMSQQLGSKW